MIKTKKLILWFREIGLGDVSLVGGKNASLGELAASLRSPGVKTSDGFAITTAGYRLFIEESGIKNKIERILAKIKKGNLKSLKSGAREIRNLILEAKMPQELEAEILAAYQKLGRMYFKNPDVAVRSSAILEDAPDASFAGQQETYLNVSGEPALIAAVKKCMASLFTDRAVSYREHKGLGGLTRSLAMAVGVQKMVRSDLASSGVMFTLDTESGFDQVIAIESAYGLGEMVVQGKINPDRFVVFKPGLLTGYESIISKSLGSKKKKFVYSKNGVAEQPVNGPDQIRLSLSDKEILNLAKAGVAIEKHFSKKAGAKLNAEVPMDIEWAKDGQTGELFILQARRETVFGRRADMNYHEEYVLEKSSEPANLLVTGAAVGARIGAGRVYLAKSSKDLNGFKKGDVLVTEITDPDWEPIMKLASAIVTDKGGRTSHAAIVSRELGVPCIVGSNDATKTLKSGMSVTVDCSTGEIGRVFQGILKYRVNKIDFGKVPMTRTRVMLNIGAPEEAFKYAAWPVKGVGLGRMEFIINSTIKIHPNALIDYRKLKLSKNPLERAVTKKIESLTGAYQDKEQFYIDNLAYGIGKIAAAFSPHDVIIRFSDFKTNEYRSLLGGELYEPLEENPMLGWRGASRYYHPNFMKAFGLECEAIKKVRNEMGLKNVVPMIPFCRTPEEGKRVIDAMKANGLDRGRDKSLKIYMMCEIPSNVILADQFLDIFDGMSIGSNDLTQLTLGLDRDSHNITGIGNENNPAVKELIGLAIDKCQARGKYIGICGQAPSDYPEFTKFLIEKGIDSVSLNPDSVLKTIALIHKEEA